MPGGGPIVDAPRIKPLVVGRPRRNRAVNRAARAARRRNR